MATQVIMPKLSPTMEEGQLSRWLKKEGDKVSMGEPLAEIDTDKATMEMQALGSGVLRKILIQEGESAPLSDEVEPGQPSAAEMLGGPDLQTRARDAAKLGEVEFQKFWNGLGPGERSALRSIGEELRRTMQEAQ